jgi:hypothetical protein
VLIDFPAPDRTARRGILESLFPSATPPAADVNLDDLAGRFDVSGGIIKNAVLDAAFRTAAETPSGQPAQITNRQLVLGFAREYQKLGKPITPAVFGKDNYELVLKELRLGRPS